jgi:hypothetical protein
MPMHSPGDIVETEMEEYEINEKDIESVIRWLTINDPQHADRETAISLLQEMKAGFHGMAHNNPELLEKLRHELEGGKQ